MLKSTANRSSIEAKHLAAYAEDPRSYCHYKGVPRSIHNKNKKKVHQKSLLHSNISRYILYTSILCFIFSGIGIYLYWQKNPNIADVILIPESVLIYTVGFFLAAFISYFLYSFVIKRSIYKLCGAPVSEYRLLGSDLIWFIHSIKLVSSKLYGIPDAVFLSKDGKIAYVCQYNPRNFNGRPKVRERYQLLLLMGMVMEKYKPETIQGAIRYYDQLELIRFEPTIYSKLMELQTEYEEAVKMWITPDIRPLFSRDKTF